MDNVSQYIVRRALKSDIEYVYKVICDLENTTFDFEQFKLYYEKNISNSDNVYLLLMNNNSHIGYISLHTQSLLHHCGIIGELQEFYINEDYRNLGLGKLLIESIEKEAVKLGCIGVEVTSNRKRTDNVEIYQKLGYTLTHNKFTKTPV